MSQIFLIFLFLAFIGLAIKHKFLAVTLVILAFLSVSIEILILIVILYMSYQNPKMKLWVDKYVQKTKRWIANKKKLYKSIKSFKDQAKERIRLKYKCEISFLCYKVFCSDLGHQEDQGIEILEQVICEKEILIHVLQQEKRA